MKRRMDVLVKCPYYKGEEKQDIVCEGLQPGMASHQTCDTQDNLRKYKNQFCKKSYLKCLWCRMLNMMKYDYEV